MCPFAQRVWLALLEKRVQHTLVQVDLSSKPRWFKQVNSQGLVPCVAYQGKVITESAELCRWVDETFEGPQLMPRDAELRSIADKALSLCSRFVSAGMDLCSAQGGRHWGIGTDATIAQRNAFEQYCASWAQLQEQSAGPYVAGEHVSVPDLVLWPFMERFLLAANEFSGYDATGVPGMAAWVDAMRSRDSVQFAAADEAMHLRALQQHRCLDWFDFVSSGAADLHPWLHEHMA